MKSLLSFATQSGMDSSRFRGWSADKELARSGGTYWCVVEGKGDAEIGILPNLAEIRLLCEDKRWLCLPLLPFKFWKHSEFSRH